MYFIMNCIPFLLVNSRKFSLKLIAFKSAHRIIQSFNQYSSERLDCALRSMQSYIDVHSIVIITRISNVELRFIFIMLGSSGGGIEEWEFIKQ